MTRRMLWSLVALGLMATAPVLASPQDPNPCTPIAPGAGCSARLSGAWASLDLGKPVVAPKPGESPWVWASARSYPLTHRGAHGFAGTHMTNAMAPPAIDCPMAKPANPTIDTRMVHAPQGHVTFSSVIVPVAPCKGK